MTQDVNTILADMPGSIGGYTICNPDTTYTIVLNARLSYERQLLAYHHEMKHIENGDYAKRCSADLIECYAHACR